MSRKYLDEIPISKILVLNPRTRNRVQFEAIVSSISAVGLKKPITVFKRPPSPDGTQYDLVCGQGRMEAFLALGNTTIPANVIDTDRESLFLMSLVENIARRPPSNKDLFREVSCLKARGYKAQEIAVKLGREVGYISAVSHLIERNEADLVEAVEANRIPLSIAVLIAGAKEPELQRALSQAYESGELRGKRLQHARSMITRHTSQLAPEEPRQEEKLTGRALVKEYERRIRERQALARRASCVRDKLLLLRSALSTLLTDDRFVILLQAENLQEIPSELTGDGACKI
jgi:ParB family chromosome partitioning protein